MPTGSHTANRCHTCEASIDTPTTPMPLGDKAPADPARYIPFSHIFPHFKALCPHNPNTPNCRQPQLQTSLASEANQS